MTAMGDGHPETSEVSKTSEVLDRLLSDRRVRVTPARGAVLSRVAAL
jgi:hypothetical protein